MREEGIIEIAPEEWHSIPDGYDVAAAYLSHVLLPGVHRAQVLSTEMFLKQGESTTRKVNAGDDVFMVGRFIGYDGIETNESSLRFGNISMMQAPIRQDNGCTLPSILVDMRSRSGYSGSPVFIYRTHGSVFARPDTFIFGGHFMKLLGIHWGQFLEKWPIEENGRSTDKYVRGSSGMTMVCPASSIATVLELPALVDQRAGIEQQL